MGDQAAGAYDRVMSDSDAQQKTEQGLTRLQQGDYNGADRFLREALRASPNHLAALQLLGNVCHARGNSAEAVSLFAKALAVSPDDSATRFNQALAFAALSRHGEAVAAFDRVLSLMPADADAWFARGASLANLRQYAAAVES